MNSSAPPRMAFLADTTFTSLLAALAVVVGTGRAAAAPFTIQGPEVQETDFRISVFATNLSYPLGMARLSDGSLLVAVSQGQSFWSSTGELEGLVW